MADQNLANAVWRKSSYSNGQGECIEVAETLSTIAIRDSKNPAAGHLSLSRERFGQLLNKIR